MAKPLPNEDARYQQLRDERVQVPPSVWGAMYYHLGNHISFINLVASFYLDQGRPIVVADAQKILDRTLLIKEAMSKIIDPGRISDSDAAFVSLKKNARPMHPIVKDFFTHYIGNDVYMINLCVSLYLDQPEPLPVPVEDVRKILDCTQSMSRFLDRLRKATQES